MRKLSLLAFSLFSFASCSTVQKNKTVDRDPNFTLLHSIEIPFNKEFKNLSAVWKIFLLHLINPNTYPIYDQHIHRTFLFIHNENWSNISNDTITNKDKEKFYFDRYLPFIQARNIKDLKQLDEAFFAFGQFLNTRNYATLLI